MFIGVGIDSENYTELQYFFGETADEVKKKFENYVGKDGPFVWKKKKDTEIIRGETDSNDYWWYVAEIFEVPKDKYYLVWYHAYEGVDFKVNSYDREVFARNYMQMEFADFITDFAPFIVETHRDKNSAIVDNDSEWNIWKIIKEEN